MADEKVGGRTEQRGHEARRSRADFRREILAWQQ